jgi:DNA-binding NarL/FixJ family response regulator
MTQLETNAPKALHAPEPPHPKPGISRALASRAPDLAPDHRNSVEGEVEKSEHLIWVRCTYSVMFTGVQKTLEKAGYVCREPQDSVVEAPLAVIYYPTGEDVAREIRRLQDLVPTTPVLVLGDPGDLSLARTALQAGACGFMHTEMKPSQIVRALSLATKGELVVPRGLVPGLIAGERLPNLLALTARQKEILGLVAEGLTNAQIAKRLFLTEGTIKQHLRAVYKLLGAYNRTEAASIFLRNNRSGEAG